MEASTGLTDPGQPSQVLQTLSTAQGPTAAPQDHQPLPQKCHSRAIFQLLTALPCPAVHPLSRADLQACVPVCPQPIPREVPDVQGWGWSCWSQLPLPPGYCPSTSHWRSSVALSAWSQGATGPHGTLMTQSVQTRRGYRHLQKLFAILTFSLP